MMLEGSSTLQWTGCCVGVHEHHDCSTGHHLGSHGQDRAQFHPCCPCTLFDRSWKRLGRDRKKLTRLAVIACGPEFGDELNGRMAKIVRAQHGLRGSGQAWRSHLATVLLEDENLGFRMCKADNDVWFRLAMKPDGTKHCEHIMVHADTHFVCHWTPSPSWTVSSRSQEVSPRFTSEWTHNDMSVRMTHTRPGFGMGSQTCVRESVKNVEAHLEKKNLMLKQKVNTISNNSIDT